MSNFKEFRRSRTNNIIGGVCGGVGEYFNIDPVIIRIICVLTLPATFWAYIIMWIIVPKEPLVYKETEKETW